MDPFEGLHAAAAGTPAASPANDDLCDNVKAARQTIDQLIQRVDRTQRSVVDARLFEQTQTTVLAANRSKLSPRPADYMTVLLENQALLLGAVKGLFDNQQAILQGLAFVLDEVLQLEGVERRLELRIAEPPAGNGNGKARS